MSIVSYSCFHHCVAIAIPTIVCCHRPPNSEEQLQAAVSKAFQEAGVDASVGIDFKVYCRVMRDVQLDMAVELPTAD